VAGAGRSPASSSPDPLVEAADATGGRVVVAEDHHPEGGLGSAVVAARLNAGVQQLRLAHLSVSELPGSGTTAELLAAAGIDATHLASAAAALIDE
jgi:transketolase